MTVRARNKLFATRIWSIATHHGTSGVSAFGKVLEGHDQIPVDLKLGKARAGRRIAMPSHVAGAVHAAMPWCLLGTATTEQLVYTRCAGLMCYLKVPAWRTLHCGRIAQVEHLHVGSEQTRYMHNPVYRCTLRSLRITPPIPPRTWIPVKRDMPQTPSAGTPATS